MILYHGSAKRFDQFVHTGVVNTDSSANGHIGTWLAVDPDIAQRFGPYLYSVEPDFKKSFRISVGDLSRLNAPSVEGDTRTSKEVYTNFRNNLTRNGFDSVAVVEWDDSVQLYIALIPENLAILSVTEGDCK